MFKRIKNTETITEIVTRAATIHETEVILRREVHDLKIFLKKFAGHTAECVAYNNDPYTDLYGAYECISDCGYTKAEKRWK